GAVVVSGFVALTLSPMMCAKLIRHESKHGVAYRAIERGLDAMTIGYRRLLSRALSAWPVVALIGAAVVASIFVLYANLKSELAPFEDQGTVVGIFVAPEGATIDAIDAYAKRLEAIYQAEPDVDRYFVVVGTPVVNQGISFIKMTPWDERDRTQKEIAGSLAPKMAKVPGVMAFPVNPPPLGQSVRNKPVEIVVKTSRPYRELETIVDELMAKAGESPALLNIETDLKLNTPQIRVNLDREKAANLGIAVETLGRSVETLLAGRQVTRFKREGEQYDVIVQIRDEDRMTPDALNRIYVRAAEGAMVPLSNLVQIEETVAPKELNHFNQMRAEILPGTARLDYAGQAREFKEASADIYITFALALAFIYLVLAAQFESFRDPLIIMLTVPLSIAGGLAGLWLSGGTLNIYSQVGLVTLIGLITKHGILIVEFANQMREEGRLVREAVVEASVLRLRPILMTTGATVFGAVPLAIAAGAGAESRQDIGWVIVGGLTVGTFFTLFVIPMVYALVNGRREQAPESAALAAEPAPVPRAAE
ncbi:MAG: efflux RND transporter permease subunit, partial [Rhodospirillales bacterium]|nr:efflux RND transporter permease subunit [Rhodospirillales bacterium]